MLVKPRHFLGEQFLGSHPKPNESKTQGVGPSNLFLQALHVILHMLNFENYYPTHILVSV